MASFFEQQEKKKTRQESPTDSTGGDEFAIDWKKAFEQHQKREEFAKNRGPDFLPFMTNDYVAAVRQVKKEKFSSQRWNFTGYMVDLEIVSAGKTGPGTAEPGKLYRLPFNLTPQPYTDPEDGKIKMATFVVEKKTKPQFLNFIISCQGLDSPDNQNADPESTLEKLCAMTQALQEVQGSDRLLIGVHPKSYKTGKGKQGFDISFSPYRNS